ncbi:calcium-dependent protein kinase 2-like isoform X2 [Hylaeus volcanicus]|uniref:calcium-dependent protein kinase 2-like isoform X2 n=1 Tax=Hylaeus volcanicus TaxID=313075 RepID=UPI0023B7ABB8|nr:calcium-dependent protein kinase 2-like isoform X2 [Hylaeus volcanicus]
MGCTLSSHTLKILKNSDAGCDHPIQSQPPSGSFKNKVCYNNISPEEKFSAPNNAASHFSIQKPVDCKNSSKFHFLKNVPKKRTSQSCLSARKPTYYKNGRETRAVSKVSRGNTKYMDSSETKGFSDSSTTDKITMDKTSLPRKAVSRAISTSVNTCEKHVISRNISNCRLKKYSDIFSTYEISPKVLGTGISGVVRVATHLVTKRQYAIKTLSREGVNAKRTAMLHNEVSIFLKLDHPNIARLIEVYESEKAIHLVMELCTGGELYDRLASKKKYTERETALVTQQMLSAINYCHQHRICHRDLKLENWVYADKTPDAPLKLIDFGFSRIFNPGVPMTAMHGTVYYVSPEVMDGCYKETCDIWSIGVIVYMLLSGSPPFNGAHDHEILLKIKRGTYSLSGPQWEGISGEAKSFIQFLLQKDSDKRPSAIEALQHSWLTKRSVLHQDISISVVKSMRDFSVSNVLRRAALGVVALGMTSHEISDLQVAFQQLDILNKGQQICDKIDITGKKEVNYTEFIAATLQAKLLIDGKLIQDAFARFDVEKKNRITLENLRSIVGDSFDGTRVESILNSWDLNHDGCLDYNEFYAALTNNDHVIQPVDTKFLCEKRKAIQNFNADEMERVQQDDFPININTPSLKLSCHNELQKSVVPLTTIHHTSFQPIPSSVSYSLQKAMTCLPHITS